MAKNLIKFFRGAQAPTTGVVAGAIWFDTAKKCLHVFNGTDWEAYDLTPALTALQTAYEAADTAIRGEIAAVVATLEGKITAEQTRAEKAEGENKAAIEAEVARAEKKEGELDAAIKAVDAAAKAAMTKVAKGDDAGSNLVITSAADETTGAVTYTIGLNDVATKSVIEKSLADEVARAEKKEGELDAAIAAEAKRAGEAETALSGRLDVIEGEGAGSIKKAVADAKTELIGGATTDGDTLGKLEDRIKTIVTDAKTYSVVKMTAEEVAALSNANVKEAYKLVDEDETAVGDPILVYKDSSLKSAAMGTEANAQKLILTYILADGTESVVPVDLSAFYAESETGNGLQVVDHVISVKVDAASESFLTVGADGVKLAGVQDAINGAVAALDATVGSQEVAEGKHIAVEVVEVDGKLTGVTVTEKDIASAAAVEELTERVLDNELVASAGLNDLHARVSKLETLRGHEDTFTNVEVTEDGEVVVETKLAETPAVEVENYTAATATGLATDAYVQDYVANQMAWAGWE